MNPAMSRLLRQFLIVCLLALPAAAEQQWTEVRSPHFLVLTDAGRDTGRKVALRFEQMRQVFGSVLQKPSVRAGVPLNIIAFRTSLEMRTALPHDPQAQGVFVSAADADYILLDLSAADPYAAVARDYANSVIVANTPPLPLWYDVGMAEYFSTVVVSPKEAQLGKPPEIVAQAASKLQPAAVFLGLDHSSAEYKTGDAGYRAQCWLMVAWLMANHQLAAVNEYARLITMEHLPPATALQNAFNLSPQQLDAELHRFAGTKFASTSYPLPPGFDDVATYSYADRKVFPLEAQASISDFHVHAAAYVDQGIVELENILKQDANNAPAHRAL